MDTLGKRLFQDEDMTGTLVSEVLDLENIQYLGVHCKWTGTPNGTLYFECSGEIGAPTTWEEFDNVPVAGSGSQFWIDREVPYRWARIRYVPSSSTGLLSADSILKGDR